jgi:hypothetical protein
VFLLIAAGHLLRILFRVPFAVFDVAIPFWVSLVAAAVAAFLSYEGFHFARRPRQ